MLDIDKIYHDMLPELERADQERQVRWQKTKPFKRFFQLCLGTAAILAILLFFTDIVGDVGFLCILLPVIGIIVYAGKYSYETNQFKEYFQKGVAPRLIENLGPDFKYNLNHYFPEEKLKRSGLFNDFNDYKCEDLVTGKIGGKPVTFAEIKLDRVRVRNKKTQRQNVFSGLILSIQLSTTFPSSLWILPSKSNLKYGFPKLKEVSGEVMEIDHAQFQNDFMVYGEDQAFTKALLRAHILDKLCSVNTGLKDQKIIAGNLKFAFMGDTIYVALSSRQKFLESQLNESINTKVFVEKQLLFLNGIYQIGEVIT